MFKCFIKINYFSLDKVEANLDEVLISNQWKTSVDLKTMTKDDKRNTIIAELGKITDKKISFLQTLSNKKLLALAKFMQGRNMK